MEHSCGSPKVSPLLLFFCEDEPQSAEDQAGWQYLNQESSSALTDPCQITPDANLAQKIYISYKFNAMLLYF